MELSTPKSKPVLQIFILFSFSLFMLEKYVTTLLAKLPIRENLENRKCFDIKKVNVLASPPSHARLFITNATYR